MSLHEDFAALKTDVERLKNRAEVDVENVFHIAENDWKDLVARVDALEAELKKTAQEKVAEEARHYGALG